MKISAAVTLFLLPVMGAAFTPSMRSLGIAVSASNNAACQAQTGFVTASFSVVSHT
jgi:hypothetical protein